MNMQTDILSNNSIAGSITCTPQTTMLRLNFSATHITGIYSHSMKHDAQRVVIEQFDSVSSAFLQLVNLPLRFRSIDFGKLWTCLRQAGCGRLCSLRWSSVLAHTLPAAPAIDHFACKQTSSVTIQSQVLSSAQQQCISF